MKTLRHLSMRMRNHSGGFDDFGSDIKEESYV